MSDKDKEKYINKIILWYGKWECKAKIINVDENGFIIKIIEAKNTASDYYQKGDIIHIGSDTVIKFIGWEE